MEIDLRDGGFLLGRGCPEYSARCYERTAKVLSLTLLRPLRTRGRSKDESDGRNESLLRELYDVLLGMFNCDIRRSRVSHRCAGSGCCKGPEDAAAKISDALVTGSSGMIVILQPSRQKRNPGMRAGSRFQEFFMFGTESWI